MIGYFLFLVIFSVLIGVGFGFGISIFFKKNANINAFPVKEIGLILLFGYVSYLLSEILTLSGILSLFIYGIIIG